MAARDPPASDDARRGKRTLQLIQIFRGAAAVMVMLYHVGMVNQFYNPFLGNFFGFGHSGIDFFFILSGFIMLYVHYEQAGQARLAPRFLALRAARIFPLYWCVLAVTVAWFWALPQTPDFVWAPARTLDPATLKRAILLYQQDQDAVVPVAWTLSYELAFYLFFSLFFVAGARVFVALLMLWSVAIAVQWSGVAYLGPYPLLLRPVVGEFFFGCLAAVVAKRLADRRIKGWWLIVPVGVVAAVARAELTGAIDGYTWYALPYFLLILVGALYDQSTARTWPRALLLLGEASYAIYLVHYGCIVLFNATIDHYRTVASLAPNLTLLLLAALILALGVLVHLGVERPLLNALRRRIGNPVPRGQRASFRPDPQG
jgi:peptidoglycan/LPS O-acetylase OafA/YrhL